MKMRIPAGFLGLVLLAVTAAVCPAAEKKPANSGDPGQAAYRKEEMEDALKTARAFLAELDKDDGRTWGFFSPLAQRATTEKDWKVGMDTLKAICGPVVTRDNLRVGCFDKLPDAPPGRYFIFDYDSKFERLTLGERIVLIKEGEGWKVAGYFRNKRAA
jgi:hypothetical protein